MPRGCEGMDYHFPRGVWATALLIALSTLPATAARAHSGTFLAALTDDAMKVSPFPLPRWQTALKDIERDRYRVQQCLDETPCRDIVARPLASLITRYSNFSGRKLLSAVNRYFNAFPYVPDQVGGKPSDDWKSPLTFLQRSGDCEDFAIAKYLTLRLLGVPEKEMAILIMHDLTRGIDHAVLLVENQRRIFVLDNLRDLTRFEAYRSYQPLFVLTNINSWRIRAVSHLSAVRPASFR